MTRTNHFSVKVQYPVYAIDFLTEDIIAYAGGGGASRSGVTNAIRIARINSTTKALDQLAELKLSKDEDAPMCMAVDREAKRILCGINLPAEKLKSGNNEALRVFSYTVSEDKEDSEKLSAQLEFVKASRSIDITDPEKYQKVMRVSPSGHAVLSAGNDGSVALQEYPSLRPAWPVGSREFSGEEIYDGDFSESGAVVVLASATRLKVLGGVPVDTTVDPASEDKTPKIIQTIQNPALGGKAACSFRAARFGRGDASRNKLYTIVNASSGGKGKGKGAARKSFVTSWNAESWELLETRRVSDKPVTVCDISSDGTKMAFASSDLSIGVLETENLRSVTKILSAHDFPSTCIRFSPSAEYLVSGSADNTIRVVDLSGLAEIKATSSFVWTLLLAVLLLLLAVYLQTAL